MKQIKEAINHAEKCIKNLQELVDFAKPIIEENEYGQGHAFCRACIFKIVGKRHSGACWFCQNGDSFQSAIK